MTSLPASELANNPNLTVGTVELFPEMLEHTLRLCEDKGLQKPSCYQGEYHLTTRGMETKLLAILRAHGMTYNALGA